MGKAGVGNQSLSLGERELCCAGDPCFRPCIKPPEGLSSIPRSDFYTVSLEHPWSSLCSCSTCKSRTKDGQTFSSRNLAASSDSWRQSFTFLPSVQLYVTPCTRNHASSAQITAYSTNCRNGEAGKGSDASLRPSGFNWKDKARCFSPTVLSFQSQNTACLAMESQMPGVHALTHHPLFVGKPSLFGSLDWTPSSTHAFWSFFELSSQLQVSIVTRLERLINSPHGLLPPRPQFSPPNQEWCHHHGIPIKTRESCLESGHHCAMVWAASNQRS